MEHPRHSDSQHNFAIKNYSSHQKMSGSFVIESAFGQKRIVCHNTQSCANHVYELPYFRGNVEQIISEGESFDAVQDLLDSVKITGATWEIPEIRTKIHFVSPEQARRIMAQLEDVAEDKYNQGHQDYQSQFGQGEEEEEDQEPETEGAPEEEDQEPQEEEGAEEEEPQEEDQEPQDAEEPEEQD